MQFSATPAKYIKYTASDITAIVDDDLFETKVWAWQARDLAAYRRPATQPHVHAQSLALQ